MYPKLLIAISASSCRQGQGRGAPAIVGNSPPSLPRVSNYRLSLAVRQSTVGAPGRVSPTIDLPNAYPALDEAIGQAEPHPEIELSELGNSQLELPPKFILSPNSTVDTDIWPEARRLPRPNIEIAVKRILARCRRPQILNPVVASIAVNMVQVQRRFGPFHHPPNQAVLLVANPIHTHHNIPIA
jgi:hypothetical protein